MSNRKYYIEKCKEWLVENVLDYMNFCRADLYSWVMEFRTFFEIGKMGQCKSEAFNYCGKCDNA